MTTSGSSTFDPSFAALFDEALERAGIDPSIVTHRHISSAKMSINLMLTEWAAKDGDALFRIASTTETVLSGDSSFALPSGAVDINGDDVVMTYSGETNETPLTRSSRQDYLRIADKSTTGRPSLFYVDQATLNTPTVVLWPVPDATCVLRYDYMRRSQTLGALSETLDVQVLWLEAVASGLAARLAAKYNVSRLPILIPLASEAYRVARRSGSGNSQVVISARGFGSGSRTRRA